MEVIKSYKAFNGKIFETEKECLDYEKSCWLGFNQFGINSDPDSAMVLFLPNLRSYDSFVQESKAANEDNEDFTGAEGLFPSSDGQLFAWVSMGREAQYVQFTKDMVKALDNALMNPVVREHYHLDK